MSNLSLSFFGAAQAVLDGTTIANYRSAKVQGLLVYLALLAQQAHTRAALAALFWPDEAETVAMKNLRQSLYRLRALLGDEDARQAPYLLVTRSTVQFNPASSFTLDVASFLSHLEKEQLAPAVALYQGELLSGFSCDSLPFEAWLQTERAKLQQLALHALGELTGRNLAQAEYQTAQTLAHRQLALEPWREEAHRQLMQALLLLGERSAALAQYEICRTVMAEELGSAPSAATVTLAKQIRDVPPVPPAPAVQDQGAATGTRQQLKTPFVGRKAELETLRNAYQQAKEQGLQLVTVQGKAGIGKTRLTEQFVTWAATQGADVLVGRAFETSTGLSYQPISHLLRQRLERENAPEDLLADLWLAQLTRLLPELRERYPDLPEPTQEEATARQHLFEAVTRLGRALAERRPLILLIEDWHWADSASLDMLHYASRRWTEEQAPILVLLTLRQEALAESSALQSWLDQLKRTVAAVPLKLGALSQAETEQLVQGLITPAADPLLPPDSAPADSAPADTATQSALAQFSHWLFTETDGQPLFLTEALKVLVEEGIVRPQPDGAPAASAGQAGWQLNWSRFDAQRSTAGISAGVRELIQGWLTRISGPARDLVTAAAVLAQAASFDNLCRVSGLDETQAVAALEELLRRQLLIEPPAQPRWAPDPVYTFSHQKVSEVVYAEAGTARRRLLHRRAFAVLQALAAPASELAHHALAGGLPADTIHYSLLAGSDAMALFAVQVAIAHFETAQQAVAQNGWPATISGADRQALYVGLGRAYELAEKWSQAQAIYQAMIASAQSLGAAGMECLGLNHLATVYLNGAQGLPQALALLEQARRLAAQNEDRRGVADTEWNLALAAIRELNANLACHHGEQALATARQLGHPQFVARCLNLLAYVYAQLRRWETVGRYAAEASQLYAAAGDRVLEADSQRVFGWSQAYCGQPRQSLVTLQTTLRFSQQIENLWGQAECAWRLAHTWRELGHYGHAINLARQGVKQTRMVGHPAMRVLALSTWGSTQRTIMALDAAQVTLLEALSAATAQGANVAPDWVPAELCAIHAMAGDWGQAHQYARQTLQAREDGALLPMALTGWYATEALLRGGDGDLARAEVAQLGAVVGTNRRYRLILLRSQAMVAEWDGAIDEAILRLQAALTLAQAIGLPGETWPILGALGRLYGEQGAPVPARAAYREAAALIRQLAATIDEEALAAGFLAAEPVRFVLASNEAAA